MCFVLHMKFFCKVYTFCSTTMCMCIAWSSYLRNYLYCVGWDDIIPFSLTDKTPATAIPTDSPLWIPINSKKGKLVSFTEWNYGNTATPI